MISITVAPGVLLVTILEMVNTTVYWVKLIVVNDYSRGTKLPGG